MNLKKIMRMASALLACCCVTVNAEETAPPNIVFIMTDQQHDRMMSCAGNRWVKTPHLDGLAADGIRFEVAYSANPVCVPSRMSMATGMMPGRIGTGDNKTGMRAKLPQHIDENSMGKIMKRAGYDTFYGGKVHMCEQLTPTSAGYDAYFRDERGKLPGAGAWSRWA